MNNDEILIIQNYLRDIFASEGLFFNIGINEFDKSILINHIS